GIPVFWIYILSLRPIVSRDALKLHMAFPNLWKDESFLFFNKFNAKIELGMMNLDYLYTILLKFFEWEQLPKIVHATFLIMTGILIYLFVKKRFSEKYAIWSYLLILTIPINTRLASEVYVDLGLLFFSTVSVIFYIKSTEAEFNYKYLLISSLTCGLAAGTKYNGFVFSAIMCLVVFMGLSRKLCTIKAAKHIVLYVFIIFVTISPWLYRNYMGSGNPFYPLFSGIFGSTIPEPEVLLFDPSDAKEIFLRLKSGETIYEIFLIPLRFFFTGKDHDFLQFDGVLNPFILFLLPFAFFWVKDKIGLKIKVELLIIFVFIILFASFYDLQRIRWALPFLAPFIILITAGYYNILESTKNYKIKVCLALLISVPIFAFNMVYLRNFVIQTDMIPYFTQKIDKNEYLRKHLSMYDIYEFINQNTPENSVIYDVLCGNRYYYVKRKYVCTDSNLNWWIFNVTYKNGSAEDYYKLISSLPNTDGLKADYLLIKPKIYYDTFKEVYFDIEDPLGKVNEQKLQGFIEFINLQTPIAGDGSAVLYKLNYPIEKERYN
ncbi:MAG: glycosyltransferase family 39 protein, partial [Candidatus Delongbacteria bacterium]|nr:glycosyltransferase family 39 protein [Candidatus Delongbacteria bacterium]